MKKYSSNLAFVDLLFNLLVGFTCLFIIAFLMINPISKKGVVEPPVKLMIEMRWDKEVSGIWTCGLHHLTLLWVMHTEKAVM